MNLKKDYQLFLVYVLVTAVLTAVLHVLQLAINFNYGLVASVSVLGMCFASRKFCSIFLVDLLEYLCSINSFLNQRLEMYLIQKDWDPLNSNSKKKSGIIFGGIQATIWTAWVIIAGILWLLCWGPVPVMSWKTQHIVHSISMLAQRISANGFGGKVATVLWLIFTVINGIMIIMLLVGLYTNKYAGIMNVAPRYSLSKTLGFTLVITLIAHFYGWFYFGYGAYRVFQDIVFWIILLVIIALVLITIIAVDALLLNRT